MMELGFDRSQIREDIGVIKFQIIQDRGFRTVVNKLAALVEKRRVVFIRFDDKKLGFLVATGQACRNTEVHRHAAYQKARIVAGIFENPRQHSRSGRLAMGTGDGKHPLTLQDMLAYPLWPGCIRQTAIEDFFHQGIAARDYVANHV